MGMNDFRKSKFVFSETFNNTTGKTSGSGFIGVLLGLTAILMAIAGTFGYFFEIKETLEFLEISVKFVGFSIILLGVRKAVGGVMNNKQQDSNDSKANPLFEKNPVNKDNEKG
jgi:hypothetical protein